MNIDRFSGAFIALMGLLMLYVVIPFGVESVDVSGLTPKTFPVWLSWLMVIAGVIQFIAANKSAVKMPSGLLRIVFLCSSFALVIYVSSFTGFIFISPVLAFVLMYFMNERRPLWLGLGVFAVPIGIWLIVDVMLGRELI
ncbi:tripartite tricarboxylate transporter TctB family protein [Marinomonas sp. 5E14-1]|uniref:tripartite tricarboxylate transporter TctB family protein n=1 Tax=Marinomonas sp. 5E14-1 TaxID=3153922 RepID=UPI00326448C1